jgi:hypothetical protein
MVAWKIRAKHMVITTGRQYLDSQTNLFVLFLYMLPFRIFIILLCCSFLPSDALRCTTNCVYTYDFTSSFIIPDRCQEIVSAGKCLGSITLWYYLNQYTVILLDDQSSTIVDQDTQCYAIMELPSTNSTFFSYDFNYACQDKDSCAQDLAKGCNK